MSSIEELEEYEAERELALKQEFDDVFGLFRYQVSTSQGLFLCNDYRREFQEDRRYPFTLLTLIDVWVWDKHRPTRILPHVEIYTEGDIAIETLRDSAVGGSIDEV